MPGLQEDYRFQSPSESTGRILGNDLDTDLTVVGVEFFQFSDGTEVAFDDLFDLAAGPIGDFVWNDLNGNGLQDPGEPGIANVFVELENVTDGVLPVAVVRTSSSGSYQFNVDVFADIEYRVVFNRPAGFEPTQFQVGSDPTIDSDAQATSNPAEDASPTFVLSQGQNQLDIDAGYVALI